ncbi:thiol reductant ABC exporter subunit CydD [Glycomyces buryatensis]|uniref:Thiol reductant ABC exporter subunit CydD n=1 Tax=Glycomyces buryatensis TaxID=2570927 RepID=A0A4S8Q7C1_9ACTN|nr:thiol reductant ABC exporter subunit CydD [Glycomyces buryatensis]THV38612.1 thiol reductant ABC exporter subunit CydD [Glycomyces buryatensis]
MTALTPTPNAAFDRRLLHRAHGAAPYIAVCAALGAAQTACVIAGAWLMATIIAAAFAGGVGLGALTPQLIALAAVLAARALLASVQESAAHRAGAGVKTALRRQVLAQLMRLPSGRHHSGETAALLVRGIDALDAYFARYLPQLVLAAIVPVGVLVVMALTYPPAALIVLVTLPLIPMFGILIGLYTRRRAESQWESTATLAHHFADLVAGLPTLKAFGRAAKQAGAIRVTTGEYRRRSMSLLRIAFCSALVLELAASLSVAIVAVTVGIQLIDGGLSGQLGLQTALLVLILAPEAYLPLRAVGTHYHASAEGLATARRLFAILGETPERSSAGTAQTAGAAAPLDRAQFDRAQFDRALLDSAPMIMFRRTVFAYPGREPLPELSLTVPAGRVTVLTARSGAGKSTLMASLLGFREPASGTITIDDTDLDQIDLARLRRSIAWMPQRPVLIDGTVADNVRLAVAAAVTDADVQRAITDARAPEPHRTVAADGSGISAGEAARVGLARLFLRARLLDTPILLLDEPTAHLDADTEQSILTALAPLTENRTVLIASHRAAVRAIADREVNW